MIELVLMGCMWSIEEAAAWGMASHIVHVVREGEGEGDGTTIVREVVALTRLCGVTVIMLCYAAAKSLLSWEVAVSW